MTSTIREQLIAAGIIVPSTNQKKQKEESKQTNSKRSSPVNKNKTNSPQSSNNSHAKAHSEHACKPHLKQRPKRKLSKVDRAILQASSCGRRNNDKFTKPERIRLFVRRGTTVKGDASCDTCGCRYGILTRYSNTSVGPIVLCTVCKVKAFEANYGHADAMPLKVDHAHAQRLK